MPAERQDCLFCPFPRDPPWEIPKFPDTEKRFLVPTELYFSSIFTYFTPRSPPTSTPLNIKIIKEILNFSK
ncbi:hypothetical protein QUA56_17980 [Microcoleus sp. N3A4]|uniref:hypothetical protein n=1 Tax=Microcoleus sp. N3A4 TaxID=3055379 RepID=UPI002FD36D77